MKKIISLFLSLMMILTMVIASSTSVFAIDPVFIMHGYRTNNSANAYSVKTYYKEFADSFDFASVISEWARIAKATSNNQYELHIVTVDDVSGDFSATLPGDLGGIDFSIDLNGHTWTVIGDAECIGYGQITVKNGTMKFAMTGERPVGIKNFILEGVNVVGTSSMDGLYSDADGAAANINLTNCTFSNFYNDDLGIFYLYQNGGKFTCSNTIFDGNKSGNDAGVIYCDGCDVVIDGSGNSTMKNNSADDDGGAIYTSVAAGCGNRVTIKGFTFENNSAEDYGGALDLGGSYNNVENCTFKGNSGDWGKDIDFYSRGATMNGCKFLDHSEEQAIYGSFTGSGNSFASNGTGSLVSNGSAVIVLGVLIAALLVCFVILNKKKKI